MPQEREGMAKPALEQLLRSDYMRGSAEFQRIIPKLQALLPKNVLVGLSAYEDLTKPSWRRHTKVMFAKLMVFLLSNKNLVSSDELCPITLKWLCDGEDFQVLQLLLSHKGPSFESLLEQIFEAAVNSGDIRIVELLLREGLNPNTLISTHRWSRSTPLQVASRKKDDDLVRVLIKAGADVDLTSDWDEKTALTYAVSNRDVRMLSQLLLAGAKVNPPESEKSDAMPPLVLATFKRCSRTVDILLTAGAPVDLTDLTGVTALHAAVSNNDIKIIERLLQAEADVKLQVEDPGLACTYFNLSNAIGPGDMAIDIAARKGCIESCQLLLEKSAAISKRTLCYATEKYNPDLVRYLLDQGAHVGSSTFDGLDPLKWAVHHGDLELVQLLLGRGADVNNENRTKKDSGEPVMTALQIASLLKHIEIARILLKADADPNAAAGCWHVFERDRACNAIQAAAISGDVDLVRTLIEAGARVNTIGAEALTPALACAVRHNDQLDIIQFLLKSGADANYNKDGFLPLIEAIERKRTGFVQALMDAGADIHAVSSEGKSALTAAIKTKSMQLVDMLLQEGIDINHPLVKLRGITALEAAVSTNDANLVRLLLSSGADANDSLALLAAVRKDYDTDILSMLLTARSRLPGRGGKQYGCAALQAAIKAKNKAIVGLFIVAGINVNVPPERIHEQNHNRFDVDYQRKPLQVAISRDTAEDFPIVRMLINAGADVDDASTAASLSGTLLCVVVRAGRLELVRLLLDQGANVNRVGTRWGESALSVAAGEGYLGIASLLLENGANVNYIPDKEIDRTCLECAARSGRIDMLQMLLNAGVAVSGSWSYRYERAVKLAGENGHLAAARMLKSYRDR